MEELIGKTKVQQWEGLTVSIEVSKETLLHETINQYGKLGWEFCQWLSAEDNKCVYIFKRPKQ